jgi:hypothetical protein
MARVILAIFILSTIIAGFGIYVRGFVRRFIGRAPIANLSAKKNRRHVA